MAFRVAILFVLVCGGCSPLLQAQNLPDWLLPSENGRDFYIQGKVHIKSDSSVTDGEVEIIRYAADTLKHKFRTEDGFYEFFLHPDFTYKVIFRHTFTDAKPIIVDTHGPEEKAWKRGFALLLDIYLERVPDGFSRQLLAEPYGRIIYNPRERLFEPDAAYSSQQMSRWVDELERVSH